jgi:hypothetical protein
MGKREDIMELSVEICSERSISSQLHGLISILTTLALGTRYEYDVLEAIKSYNNKAEWANSTGVHHHPIFDLPETK